jgi:hypothetical protein
MPSCSERAPETPIEPTSLPSRNSGNPPSNRHYYKCNRKIAQHAQACPTLPLRMERLDAMVLEALAEKVLDPQRLKALLAELKKAPEGVPRRQRRERDGPREGTC